MYKRITLFTFICLLALAGVAQNKDNYTILLLTLQIKCWTALSIPRKSSITLMYSS